ncbi:8180_t:CDS:2, partial [Acaulospora morrowiae]
MLAAGINKALTLDTKRKRTAISGFTKREICQKLFVPSPPKQKDLALIYNISEQADDSYNAQLKKERLPGFPITEKVLERWLQYAFARQIILTDEILIEKAKIFASNIGEEHFRGSNGWLARFKLRHGIRMYIKIGESGNAPSENKLNVEQERLRAIIAQYPLDNVWNADETCIFWRQEPKKTLATSPQQ